MKEISKVQMMVAKSGEVFYVRGGVLLRKDTIADYQAMLDMELRMKDCLFKVTVKDITYTIKMSNREMCKSIIMQIEDFDTMAKELERYFNEYKEAVKC